MSTVVSMTLPDGRTGNFEYKDSRIPSDEDLLSIAKKYNMDKDVKVTITLPSKVKDIYVCDVVDGKLVKRSYKVNSRVLHLFRRGMRDSEMRLLDAFSEYADVDVRALCEKNNISYEEILEKVSNYKDTRWHDIPDEYSINMVLCVYCELFCKNVLKLSTEEINIILRGD